MSTILLFVLCSTNGLQKMKGIETGNYFDQDFREIHQPHHNNLHFTLSFFSNGCFIMMMATERNYDGDAVMVLVLEVKEMGGRKKNFYDHFTKKYEKEKVFICFLLILSSMFLF